MSLTALITLAAQAELIRTKLAAWATPYSATVKVLPTLRKLWEEVIAVDETPRVLLSYAGEKSRGAFPQMATRHRVDREWIVVIVRGHGFTNRALQVVGDKGEEPFFTTVESLREAVRVMGGVTEEFPVDFKAVSPLPAAAQNPIQNVYIDGYTILFSTANDIPAVSPPA